MPVAGRQRQQQEAVRQRTRERRLARHALRIDMDELVVPGAVGELVDARLVDGDPFGGREFPAYQRGQSVDGKVNGFLHAQRRLADLLYATPE